MLMGFGDFDKIMKAGTKQRREQEEHRLAVLRDEVAQLEANVVQETRRRLEMGRGVQTWAGREMKALEARLKETLEQRDARMNERVDGLAARLQGLEEKFAQDKAEVMAHVDRRNRELLDKLQEFHELLEAEKRQRRQREQELDDQVSAAERASLEAISAERLERERVATRIKTQLDDSIAVRHKADERFRAYVAREVAELKTGLEAEKVEREREDTAILDSLTRYVHKLQASLHVVNTMDADL